ncbi:uncharacterized protein C2orf42 homolog [Chanos chanos]|uniref:Uncharacterized protein C2orf42 homolog n=1 Tax=Chanos chanos TaxID=29144 RepID=A0A6J2UT94_CHACN|nr:uncharacterized protein C2orf42 homolog [Chanos chanos]
MEGTPVDSGLALSAQTVVSPVTQTPMPANLTCKPPDRRNLPAFLSNLGKPTLRGIRKCPQCGVYNGTRGLSCKNEACGIIFRSGAQGVGKSSKKAQSEVVRVVTDGGGGAASGPQVFSVRQKGRGLEQRGFVELFLADTAIATADGTLLTRVNLGRCLVPSCRHSERASSVGGGDGCQQSTQTPESPCIHVKQAMECQGQATPLPFKSSVLEALPASTQAKEELWRLATETPGPLVQRVSSGTLVVKCQPGEAHPLGLLHLTVGGGGAIGKGDGGTVFRCACQLTRGRGTSGLKSAVNTAKSDGKEPDTPPFSSPLPRNTSLSSEHCLHFYACVCALSSDEKLASEFAAFLNYNSNGSSQHVDEGSVSLTFQQWLASVTERIHQTMHFQFDGKPEPLVFHIPKAFFNALQQRLSLGSKKRRLPNSTTTFVRKDALPLGSFSKYTWHITNLMQVKRIFDTPELPLELTQSFVRNSDGTCSPFHCQELSPELASDTGQPRTDRPQTIKPLELRTFLKVGMYSGEQREPVPFVIEWIPDILPHSHVGELRIRFEYGHQLRGQADYYGRITPGGPERIRPTSTEENTQTQPGPTVQDTQDTVT